MRSRDRRLFVVLAAAGIGAIAAPAAADIAPSPDPGCMDRAAGDACVTGEGVPGACRIVVPAGGEVLACAALEQAQPAPPMPAAATTGSAVGGCSAPALRPTAIAGSLGLLLGLAVVLGARRRQIKSGTQKPS